MRIGRRRKRKEMVWRRKRRSVHSSFSSSVCLLFSLFFVGLVEGIGEIGRQEKGQEEKVGKKKKDAFDNSALSRKSNC